MIVNPDRYGTGWKGSVARFFVMKDDSRESFKNEILGGLTLYLSSLSLFGAGGGTIVSSCSGNTTSADPVLLNANQISIALATGIATFLMGFVAKLPIVIGPGLPFAISFNALLCSSKGLDRSGGLAANLIVGCALLPVTLLSKNYRAFRAIPEDFRLGMGAGIAALIAAAVASGISLTSLSSIIRTPDVVPFTSLSPKVQDSLLRVPILSTLGLILIVIVQVKGWNNLGILSVIFFIALLSNVIRVSIDPSSYTREWVPPGSLDLVANVPSFETWNSQTSFNVFRYILINVIEKMFDNFSTVTAVSLLLVISNLGYNKSMFLEAMNGSDKISSALIIDAIVNIFVSPFLGTVLLTPFIESVAGIMGGARTGLAAVVAGLLYLITAPFISYVILLFSREAINPGIVYASIYVIRSVQYMDFRRPVLFFPSLLVFIFIPISFEIGFSSSVCYLILFFVWFLTKWWICIKPQMIFTFMFSSIFILARSTLCTTSAGLGIAIGIVILISAIFAIIIFLPWSRTRLTKLCNNSSTDQYFEEGVLSLTDSNSRYDARRISRVNVPSSTRKLETGLAVT